MRELAAVASITFSALLLSACSGCEAPWSVPGVIPWHENPMTAEGLLRFEAACVAAGKHLCRADEWE